MSFDPDVLPQERQYLPVANLWPDIIVAYTAQTGAFGESFSFWSTGGSVKFERPIFVDNEAGSSLGFTGECAAGVTFNAAGYQAEWSNALFLKGKPAFKLYDGGYSCTGCRWAESGCDDCIGNSLGTRQVLEALDWYCKKSPPSISLSMDTTALGNDTLEAMPNSKGPALRIFCGDLNVEKDSRSFRKLTAVAERRVGLFDAVPDSEATFGNVDDDGNPTEWCLTFKMDQKRPRVLDHILADCSPVSASVVAMLNDDQYTHHLYQQASDHRGVEAKFLI